MNPSSNDVLSAIRAACRATCVARKSRCVLTRRASPDSFLLEP